MSTGIPKPCEMCGREIYKGMLERYSQYDSPFVTRNLPDFPKGPGYANVPVETLKIFKDDYMELAVFAAWVCDVPLEKYCRADMMRATGAWAEIARRVQQANEDGL